MIGIGLSKRDVMKRGTHQGTMCFCNSERHRQDEVKTVSVTHTQTHTDTHRHTQTLQHGIGAPHSTHTNIFHIV